MATSPQVHSTISKYDWMLHPSAPRIEAEALVTAMRQKNESIESIRELIDVPAEISAYLRAFARSCPEEAELVELSLSFRQRVAEAFEKLICKG